MWHVRELWHMWLSHVTRWRGRGIRLSHACISLVWLFVIWLIHTYHLRKFKRRDLFTCEITHDSFARGIHMHHDSPKLPWRGGGVIFSYQDIRVTWLIHMCDTTLPRDVTQIHSSQMRRRSQATQLIHTWHVSFTHDIRMHHDSPTLPWRGEGIKFCLAVDMTHSNVTRLIHVTWLMHVRLLELLWRSGDIKFGHERQNNALKFTQFLHTAFVVGVGHGNHAFISYPHLALRKIHWENKKEQ